MKEELLNNLNTQYIGRNIIYYEQLNSTQLRAKEIKNDVPDGTIVITANQTNGIGTHDRKWYMGTNENITFTLVLKPKCNVNKIKNLTILIAKCMIQAIQELYGKTIDIKEPNDLMLNGKKLGGILTQATTEGEIVKDILIGIGINVNQQTFPDELKTIATSLKIEFNENYNAVNIISTFLSIFEQKYIESLD